MVLDSRYDRERRLYVHRGGDAGREGTSDEIEKMKEDEKEWFVYAIAFTAKGVQPM